MKRLLLALATCAFAYSAQADDYIMLKVNDAEISAETVQKSWKNLFPNESAPALDTVNNAIRQNVLRGVVTEQLLYGEAAKQGVENSPEFKEALEEAKRKLMIRQLLNQRGGDLVSEDAVVKAYAQRVAILKGQKEIHARHILVDTKKQAEEVEEKLEDGESFSALAKELSKDPGSASQGGDLGYFTNDKMVKEFSDAAFAMEKGETSKPVKSPFGWHIIMLEDIRPVTVPTLDAMRDEIHGELQEKALNSYVNLLLDKAKIIMFDAKGNEVPFDKKPKALDSNRED